MHFIVQFLIDPLRQYTEIAIFLTLAVGFWFGSLTGQRSEPARRGDRLPSCQHYIFQKEQPNEKPHIDLDRDEPFLGDWRAVDSN
ncbi:hypothetical protein [Edaphobacter aggregans]|uniref:hypothetical protein n=1 Tax=Edaphobacter aggregans TaxID=570835 RepID=UPI00054EFE60|nr:hypothetical protein [Edaphobacter aggregans]